jgi:ATP-binding protein involved in chromosome partitioning
MTSIDDIRERLTEIRPPGIAQNIVSAGMVRAVDRDEGRVVVHLEPVPMPAQSLRATVADIERAVGALDGVDEVRVQVMQPPSGTGAGASAGGAQEVGPLPGVRDIVAVASTKGGVGKSTVATNLALALQAQGRRVGLMDADVYGPSIPIMLGLSGRPLVSEDKRIAAHEKFGLRVMSIGFFLDDNSPVIWRGPLVMGLVRQFLRDVDWGDLDLLIIDLPPGTGDAALTLVQQVPVTGGVVVTTPQDVATLDVQRGLAMFQQVHTPVFGIVENMSFFECPKCHTREDLFGSGGADKIAGAFGVPVLGHIPLVPDVRRGGDAGKPIVVDLPEHPVSRTFAEIARQVLQAVEEQHASASGPTIIG